MELELSSCEFKPAERSEGLPLVWSEGLPLAWEVDIKEVDITHGRHTGIPTVTCQPGSEVPRFGQC